MIIDENFTYGSTTPKLIATLPGENGTDRVWFNPGDNHYFFANSGGSPPAPSIAHPNLGVVDALGEAGGSTAKPEEDLPSPGTAIGSHSVAADPVGNQVYMPIGTRGAASGICEAKGGSNSNGCIAVFTVTSGTDDPGSCFQQGG